MPKVYAIDGITPVVAPSAYVHPPARTPWWGRRPPWATVRCCTRACCAAALAFVKAEERIPPRALAAGIPARVLRQLTAQELAWKTENMHLYQALAMRSATTMREVEALAAPEPHRGRMTSPAIPLSELKKRHG